MNFATLLSTNIYTSFFLASPEKKLQIPDRFGRRDDLMGIFPFIAVLLALPSAIVAMLTLIERYTKWRANHAKKER